MIIYIITAIIIAALFMDAWLIEPRLLLIRKHEISCDIKKSIRIIHFSDTHFHKHFSRTDLLRLITKINQYEPDFIVFTGDLMDHYNQSKKMRYELPPYLKAMNARYAKLAVYGNHDIGGGAKLVYKEMMEESGFQVLRNERIVFEKLDLAFFGIDDVLAGYEDKSITEARLASTQVLLLHEPDFVDRLNLDAITLTMSGHTHGGQIRLPFFTKLRLPKGGKKYIKGMYRIKSKLLSVNCGIGTTVLPFRFICPSEIVLYDLKSKKNKKESG